MEYHPYLRGKQYELLALREFAKQLDGRSTMVHPIVEPVRAVSGSGLERCADALEQARMSATIVVNPAVGDLADPSSINDDIAALARQSKWWMRSLGVLANDRHHAEPVIAGLAEQLGAIGVTFVALASPPDLDRLSASMDGAEITRVVVDASRPRSRRAFRGVPAIALRDPFVPADRNADYLDRNETLFTDDHLYAAEEGWSGVGDFATVGSAFVEGGFTPRAVAIHWTYPRADGAVMIRHFTSESNSGTGNVGGKFLEALGKLVAFVDRNGIDTIAAEAMRAHLANQTYPGLGVIKKLSILNHLEVMDRALRS